jgi:hypothetical protein
MLARGSGSAEEATMQDETVLEETELEPDVFGIEPDADDPSYIADPDDVHGSDDHPAGAR